MARRTIINDDIPSIQTPWDDGASAYSGEAVEKFIKGQLTAKIGWPVISPEKDGDGYYHIWGFADKDSYLAYMADPDENAGLRLANIAIPLIEEQEGVRNMVTLTRVSSPDIVTNKPAASVTVKYQWQQYNPATGATTDLEEDATVTVQCRARNASGAWGAWGAAKEFAVNIQSGQTKTIDLSRLLTSDATYQVRLTAVGESSGLTASPVSVTVVYSNVGLKYEGSIGSPYRGATASLPFRVTGSASKQLKVRIGDYTKTYSLGTTAYTESLYTAAVSAAEFGFGRGAVKAEAWVAFGEGYEAETEHVAFQFIYVPNGDTTKTPILVVSDVVAEFPNWTRAAIFKYAIYNPATDSSPLRITLQDKTTGQVYVSREQTCENGQTYEFAENFAIEVEADEQPAVIEAQATFADFSGATYGNTLYFAIDNAENFAPTKGATLVLSPERESLTIDGQAHDALSMLDDPEDTNSGWGGSVETDTTGAAVSVPVLSVAAGNKLTIPYTLFTANTGQLKDGQEGSLTIELDIKVKNIVGNAPVVDASAPYGGKYTGLKVYPTRAVCLSRNNNSEDVCDAGFMEETREHITINIIRDIRGEGLNLVRVYINGIANRSYLYTASDGFVPAGAQTGATSIVIGSDEADVDIYGIRVYAGQQLGSAQIQADYMASMPTIEDKKLFKRFQSIYNGSEISYDQCNAMGLNTILRRIPAGGHYPSKLNPEKQKGVDVDVRIYAERGDASSLDTAHSGTFSGMTCKGQGTSAKGYYWWNISDNFEESSVFNSLDGESQVDAASYEIAEGRSGITKLVGKCNYASPMQSHKLGGVWAYDELWQALVNVSDGGSRQVLKGTHAACFEMPFLAFYQIGDGAPVFCGMQTWGSGKGDKKTFGYDKKTSPDYMCVSGADNGAIAALFQMPWQVSKKADGTWGGNLYASSVTINTGDTKNGYCYKSGGSDTLAFEVEIGNKYDSTAMVDGVQRYEDEAKGGTEQTLYTHFADFANFICACSPLLLPYTGTAAQLAADSPNLKRDHQYWLHGAGADTYKVYYYNPATAKFEPLVKIPTAWDADGRAAAWTEAGSSTKLTDQLAGMSVTVRTAGGEETMTLEDAMATVGAADKEALNELFRQARVSYFKARAESYMDTRDIIYHQCFCKLFACTDNRAKNTYYWIDPAVDKRVRLKQDDLDTILATDNQGRQTKPYHVLEHTKNAAGTNYWNGENNVLYTLIELAYPERMRTMLKDMFGKMAEIGGSVDGYLQKRFFWVQEYFPAAAYNEAGRVLYEAAQVMVNNGTLDVSQDPITQAVGDQLQCERQFMAQRLPMLMSWCEYEPGTDGVLTFRSSGDNPVYDLTYTAYQHIYPKMAIGGNVAALYAMVDGEWAEQRGEPYLCAPGETVRFVASTDSNTQLSVRWMHYAKSLGNLGGLPCADEGSVSVSGRRLRELTCKAEGGGMLFRPNGLTINNCRNLESVDLTGADSLTGGFDGSELPRLRKLLLAGTGYSTVALPKTSTLTEVAYPAAVAAIEVDGQPNLSELTAEGLTNLAVLRVKGKHKLGGKTQTLAQTAYAQASGMTEVAVDNINWTSFPARALMWLQGLGAELTGEVHLSTATRLTLADKIALGRSYGNIDSAGNALYVDYARTSITALRVTGPGYMRKTGVYEFAVAPTPAAGNNIALKADGTPEMTWAIDSAQLYASFADPTKGTLTVTSVDTSGDENRYLVSCAVKTMTGAEVSGGMMAGFYRRVPKVGDFAYADGTFDDQYLVDKTIVGLVYKIDEMWQGEGDAEPIAYIGYSKPSAADKEGRRLIGHRVLVDANGYVDYLTTSTPNGRQWGLEGDSSANGFASLQNEMMAALGGASPFDVPGVSNFSNAGVVTGNQYSGTLTTDTYLDNQTDDGFKVFATTVAIGDFRGEQNTDAIMAWANHIFDSYLMTDYNESVNTGYTDALGETHTLTAMPTTLEELKEALETLEAANNSGRYQQFLFPAANGCRLYEPSVRDGEALDPQYAKGKWYLPSAGELGRKSWYLKISYAPSTVTYTFQRGKIDDMIKAALEDEGENDIKAVVTPSHAETGQYTMEEIEAVNRYYHTLKDCDKPAYAMAVWRAAVTAMAAPMTQYPANYHWTSTEFGVHAAWPINTTSANLYYNANAYIAVKEQRYYVRAVAAYRYMIDDND